MSEKWALVPKVQRPPGGRTRRSAESWGPCRPALPEARGTLTLHVPRPPDGIIEPDLVSPLELQALEILPLGGHQLPTER